MRCTLVKLLIADDHSYLVQGVMMSLKNSDIEVLEHILDSSQIINAYLRLNPDVILCDIMFGQTLNGLDIVKNLLELDPAANVILFSQYDQDQMIYSAYKFGAKAFLPKSVAASELIDAIHAVSKGDLYFTADIALKMAKMNFDKKSAEKTLEEILTPREIEVMRLIADGVTEKEVAEKFDLSTKTVANIKTSIKEKLNIDSPAAMTKLALKHGLIQFD